MSEKNTLGIVLDKSNNISVLFLDKRYDYTDKVLDLLLKNSGNKNTSTPNRRGISEEDAKQEKLRLMQDKTDSNSNTQSRRKK